MDTAVASSTAPEPPPLYTLVKRVAEYFGGPCWIRTNDQEIMSFLL